MKYKNIFYCANVPGKNAGNRRDYFIKNTENLVTFHYQLGYSKENSYLESFHNGKLIYRKEFGYYKGSSALIKNGLYYLLFLYILLFKSKRNSFVIVTTPIYCLLNTLFGVVKKARIVYWIEDYFPPSDNLYMKIYNYLVNYYNERLKFVLYISPPVAKIYSSSRRKNNKIIKIVSLGIKPLRIHKAYTSKKIKVGFIGIIRKEQGLDLAFKFLKENINVQLEIVGEGYDSNYYKAMAKKLGISKKVVFYGFVVDPSSIVKGWNIGIALYQNSKQNFSIYSEPSKIKNYLSFGLPVITTKATYFYDELEEYNAGIAIEENTKALAKATLSISSNYIKYSDGVKKIQKKYEYSGWYSKKFDFLLE